MKRLLTPLERQELLMVARLQRMNVYPVLIRKLTDGETAASVARWAMTLGIEGAPGAWGFSMWYKCVSALKHEVSAAREKMRNEEYRRRRTVAPVVPEPEAVLMKVNQMVADKELLDYMPKSVHEVFKHVLGEDKRMKALHLLTYEAIKQVGRIERMTELESKMPFMLPNGHQEIAKLTEIAGQMARYELGLEMLRGRYGMLPQAAAQDADLPPMAKDVLQFDEVDRSLLREVTLRTIELAREKSHGRFEAVPLETDSTGTGAATKGDNRGVAEEGDATRP